MQATVRLAARPEMEQPVMGLQRMAQAPKESARRAMPPGLAEVVEPRQVARSAICRSSHRRANPLRSSCRTKGTWTQPAQPRLAREEMPLAASVWARQLVGALLVVLARTQPPAVPPPELAHSMTRRNCHKKQHRQGFRLGRKDSVSSRFSFE
jgi:hypothetical protein